MENKIMNQKGLASWLIWSALAVLFLALVAIAYFYYSTPTGLAVLSNNTRAAIPSINTPAKFVQVTTVPLDLAKNQGVVNNIVITFSEAMNPSTINENTFNVKGPNNADIEGIITSDTTKKIWTFNPINQLEFNSVYEITITTGAKGVSGNSLIRNFIGSFTTSYGSSSGGSSGGSGSGSTPSVTLVLTSITFTPTSKILNLTTSQQMNTTGLDQNGAVITSTFIYNTTNSSVATVNASGFITAVAIGNTTITVSNGAVSNTSLITVVSSATDCLAVSVDLLTAGNYAIFAGTAIGKDGTAGTLITGDIGVGDGVTSTAITGFSEAVHALNDYSTSIYVVGRIYAADYTGGQIGSDGTTPVKVLQAISDVGTIFTTANGLDACVTELGAGNIGGMTLAPGVYKWGSSTTVLIPSDLTLVGSATDVWVFQIGKDLDLSSATQIKLAGGALAKNVFWIVTETTTINSDSIFNGNIISGPGTSTIALLDRAVLNGRALSGTDVTLVGNPVTKPSD